MKLYKGTAATKRFYDRVGWQRKDGKLVDAILFGWVDEPIRRALDLQRKRRLREMVGGPGLKLLSLRAAVTPLCSWLTSVRPIPRLIFRRMDWLRLPLL
jgi:hypothetical protein